MTETTPDTSKTPEAKPASDAKTPQADTKAKPKAKSEAKPKAKPAKTGLLTVIGPKAGFWRAGIRFSDTPQSFGPGDLTDAQIDAIKAEPKLVITNRPDTE